MDTLFVFPPEEVGAEHASSAVPPPAVSFPSLPSSSQQISPRRSSPTLPLLSSWWSPAPPACLVVTGAPAMAANAVQGPWQPLAWPGTQRSTAAPLAVSSELSSYRAASLPQCEAYSRGTTFGLCVDSVYRRPGAMDGPGHPERV